MNDAAMPIPATADVAVTTPALPDASVIPAPARRGRKSETPAERVARLKQQLDLAENAARDAERRAHALIGQALLAEAEGDTALKSRIRAVLQKRITGVAANADIARVVRL